MSTAVAPAIRTDSDPRRSVDTGLDLMSRAHTAGGRGTLCVLVANQQPIIRHGLWELIASQPDLRCVGETDDGREAVRLARHLRPDVVLIDLWIPNVDTISVTRVIRAELPNTRVIVMCGVDSDAAAVDAIRAGAAAYLPKDARIDDLLRTLRGAGAGQVTLPAQTVARMVRLVGGHDVLSRRQIEILRLVARGLANKQIARELGITESTVKTHVSNILATLSLPSRTQLALYAARTGLVALHDLNIATYPRTADVLLGA